MHGISKANNTYYNNSGVDVKKNSSENSSSLSSEQSGDDSEEIRYLPITKDRKKLSNISHTAVDDAKPTKRTSIETVVELNAKNRILQKDHHSSPGEKQKTNNVISKALPAEKKGDEVGEVISKKSTGRKALSQPNVTNVSSHLTTAGSPIHKTNAKVIKSTFIQEKENFPANDVNKPLPKLTENETYTKIFEKERGYKKGGLFEIYYREAGNDHQKKAHEALENTLKEEKDFFFVNAKRTDMANDILTRDVPHESELKQKQYLIREKNTLRFASDAEKSYLVDNLKDGALAQAHGDHLEKLSYGRMVMANHRAVKRYDQLITSYGKLVINPNNSKQVFESPVFNFEPAPGFGISFRGLQATSEQRQQYGARYNVTLKDSTLSLKKVFEILQVYCSSHEGDERITKPYYPPLRVSLTIGGKAVTFVLSQYIPSGTNFANQMMVSMQVKGKNEFKGNSYTFVLGNQKPAKGDPYGLITKPQTYQSQLAQDILDCLNSRMDSDINKLGTGLKQWGGKLDPQDLEKYVEFIVLTQIVESNIMPNSQDKSRTPGMNKLARKLFKNIADGETTFEHAFIHTGKGSDKKREINSSYGYPPIGTGGTEMSRNAVKNVTREGAHSHDMSEDSDEVI